MLTDELNSAERVHYAMLKGELPRISMMQCAHTWGAEAVRELNYANELRADLKTVSDVLAMYDEPTPWQQAQAAVAEVDWLKNELMISKDHERAFKSVLEQEQAELRKVRRQLNKARECMYANDPLNAKDIFGRNHEEEGHEQSARQATGPAGTE